MKLNANDLNLASALYLARHRKKKTRAMICIRLPGPVHSASANKSKSVCYHEGHGSQLPYLASSRKDTTNLIRASVLVPPPRAPRSYRPGLRSYRCLCRGGSQSQGSGQRSPPPRRAAWLRRGLKRSLSSNGGPWRCRCRLHFDNLASNKRGHRFNFDTRGSCLQLS